MSCASTLFNGTPLIIFGGTDDQSEDQIEVTAIPRPQHLPVYFIQSQRGPLEPQIVFGGQRDLMYGSASFSESGLYTNHQTIASNVSQAAANSHMLWRVSSGQNASLLLSLEVTPVDVPIYTRDTFGQIVYDLDGAPIPVAPSQTTPGYKLRWIAGESTGALGASTITSYTQAGASAPTMVYPIIEAIVDNPGAFGDNIGIRLFADTLTGSIDTVTMDFNKAFPYRMVLVENTGNSSSPKLLPTISNDRSVTVSLSPTAVLRSSGTRVSSYIETVIATQYQNLTDARYSLRYSPFGNNFKLYENNVTQVLQQLATAERTYLAANPTVVTGVTSEALASQGGYGLINLVSARAANDVPYYAIAMDEADLPNSSVRLTQYTSVYARGGSDDIMSVEDYELAVVEAVRRYADCLDPVQDIARRPETILYDTGFTMATKLELPAFVSQRPDLNLVLSTHVDSNEVRGYTGVNTGSSIALSMAEEVANASLLQNRARLIPESEIYGTPTARVMIVAGSGVIRNSEWRKRVPVTMDTIYKAGVYMGASDGKWNKNGRFSRAPGNIISMLTDITVPWVPVEPRVRNWDAGINMVLAYNEMFYAMPAYQTVYPNDSSILNNWLATLAIAYLNKIAHAAWREFRGVDDLSDADLENSLNNFVKAKIDGIWDDRYLVIPNAEVTADDQNRTTSWHLNVDFGGTGSKQIEIVHITAYKRADLEALTGGQ